MLVDFTYRGHVSQRVTQGGDYGFARGGRVEITYDSYALNEQEWEFVQKEYETSDAIDSMKFSSEIAESALEDLKEDLKHFLDGKYEEDIEAEKKKKEKEDDINPFTALWDLVKDLFRTDANKLGKMEKIDEIKEMKKDNFIERQVRADAAEKASSSLYTVYDIYKKAHGQASASSANFENEDKAKISPRNPKFEDIFSGQTGHPQEIRDRVWTNRKNKWK